MSMMRILVVDASSEVRTRVVRSLSELAGIVVQGAVADVRDATRAVEAIPLDGIVTGTSFPEGDVMLLLAAAQRRQLGAVVVFATIDAALRERYLAAGASHIIEGRIDDLTAAILGVANAKEEVDPFALVGRLAVGVAHDINNYLAAAEVSLAFAERAARDDIKRDLRQVRASFDGITRIARSLTSYARGGQPVAEQIELEPLIRRTLDAFGRMVPEGVRVILEAAGNVPAVHAVASELEQVILNLVINACDAMVWGGTLWLILERGPGGNVRLEVADTGRGLPPEVLASTGATTPSSRHGKAGGGLGLGIVRAIVDRHGGSLTLGRSSGGGTSVAVLLPT
jgi:C4-dicarboxylate-specific signal transduction histidine kinase